ncbi:MAG: hypothetical protein A3F54_00915 [Candidatus Kerfeldbacteria bacterium RIFCSPHIGHO2_12_FULL_48_17]|uniref:FAD/NAD(P)-binding domain-containing protein n=1 Tax=Candidatus Kerfeldbacteria bacterium RIFCSPHIGHO2_12_FULL_48_17 TaxID=1798542 RepID=A0A1G2B5W6_9BACT|nr:MAG: hypothetical protein A3F54_00915 [Candidatus Kerfeldbacteria bacterium RIFCSPHIGHO2_12_FULL_48_17]
MTATPNTTFDLVIIGGGAAGLAAALYASRQSLKTLVLTKDIGGQAARTPEIENYPGLPLMDGFDMMMLFKNQAEKFGTQIAFKNVASVSRAVNGKTFTVHTNDGDYAATAILLAFGLTPRDLGVPGEKEFQGKGVSYCATCDAPFFKGKSVVVAGGGPHAMEAAELLSKFCPKVYMVHKAKMLGGLAALKEKVKNTPNIELLLETEITEILGEKKVTAVKLQPAHSEGKEGTRTLEVDGVFVEQGYVVKSEWVQEWVEFDERQQIVINNMCETKTPGIFAAGDVTSHSYKQVVISAGEGAKAALTAYKYIQIQHGKRGVVAPDWGVAKK